MSDQQQPRNDAKKRPATAQIFGIISTCAAIALGGITIWQTASIRHLDAQSASVKELSAKVDGVKEAVNNLDLKVTGALSVNSTKIEALEKRFDTHEARENRK